LKKHMQILAVLVAMMMFAVACANGDPGADTTPTPGTDNGDNGDNGFADWPDDLVLGLVPSREADVLVETAEPLANHLAQELSAMAGRDISVESFVPTDYAGLVEAMGTGQADIGAFGPIALVQAADRHGAVVILQSVRRGSTSYHTQWMTNDPDRFCEDEPQPDDNGWLHCNGTLDTNEGPVGEDSLANIEDGETVFFVSPSSASGYFYPATQLERAGTSLDDVDVQFSGGHDASVLAILRGDASVAVSFDDARSVVAGDEPDVGDEVIVFAYSDEIPNDGFAVRGDLPQSLIDAIQQILLDYADTDEGIEVLDSIYEIEGLVEADLSALDAARQVEQSFGDQ
jgi:phosphonate transport system substrate-binding protein